ncbi:MAG: sigma 54-interacting transcriptional regulator [Lentisphaerae bacterium]|nr:sigma 54-interacting transcriptional regulator [Lentisphaerota bacterium]
MNEPTRILFVCTHNACRSQMAEGFARARGAQGVEVFSAGTAAGDIHPLTRRVMAEAGVDIAGQRAKTLDALPDVSFDVVVTLCGHAAETCPILPGYPPRVNWNLPDPAAVQGDAATVLRAFRDARDTIRRLVDDLFERGYLAALTGARRSEALILDHISDGIMAHDFNRRIFFFNRAAERITGYRAEEVLSRDCHDVFPDGFCGGKCLFEDGPPAELPEGKQEVEIAVKDGERRVVERTVSLLASGAAGRPQGVAVSFRDVTEERRLARRVGEVYQFAGIIGRDRKMLEIYDLIREVAETSVPVLIQGESGTGKELVAAAIHNESSRANKLFVPVNCGALPEALLESELFGHVKGAFTGAVRDKKGRFELAHGGTIFLDEIGDIAPAMQVKLLRVLQEGRFEPVGGESTRQVDARVVSATNKDIAAEIAAGRFREDLYYRLSVLPIVLPPLRERRNDIPLLAEHILRQTLRDSRHTDVALSPEALDVMLSYDWPGNVRELQNWIQFALVKCRGETIRPRHLPPGIHAAPPRPAERAHGRKLDRESVRLAIARCGGNKVKAARELGVSRATLYRFLKDAGEAASR